jgi:nucleoside-diphosphate-sugar epimerase
MGCTQNRDKVKVLIVGATGQLGALITKSCLKHPNLIVNIMVRNPEKNTTLCKEVLRHGGHVIKADVNRPDTIAGKVRGIHTVISALASDDDNGQYNLLNEVVKSSSVKRFVPSDFALDYTQLKEGEHPIIDQVMNFRKKLKDCRINGLHINSGCFMEYFFHINSKQLNYWGDAETKINFTSCEDTARFVAEAVADPELYGDLRFCGDTKSIKEIAEIYNKVRGANLEPHYNGSIQDLRDSITALRNSGDTKTSNLMGLILIISEGKGRFVCTDNATYGNVKAMTVEDYLKYNPVVKIEDASNYEGSRNSPLRKQ